MSEKTKALIKTEIKDMTKAEIADYALAHFGKTVNRKKGRDDVISEFKKFEKDHIADIATKEEEKLEKDAKRKKDVAVVIEKQDEVIDEKTNYPSEMKDNEGETTMHRPCKGAICLGDPPTRQVVDGETVTNSAPHLK